MTGFVFEESDFCSNILARQTSRKIEKNPGEVPLASGAMGMEEGEQGLLAECLHQAPSLHRPTKT